MNTRKCGQACVALVLILLTGCENAQFGAREKGALAGGALGAGLGAIVGNQTGSPGAGVAIGSALGALSGALIGNEMDNQGRAMDERESRLAQQDREIAENRKMIEELKSRGVEARLTERGVVANLPDVLFDFDSARLTSSARRVAGEIAQIARDNERRRIAVEGHTDAVGSASYNQRLSEARADSVADALIGQGVSRNRLSVRGYGKTRPIASNETESGRSRNRRVEVIIENR